MDMQDERGRFKKGTHWRERKPFWDKEWLINEYVTLQRSASEIAADHGVTANAICFWLQKHGIPGRTTSETRAFKHWGAKGSDNPMWNKRGEANPNWKGGMTPERQAFYMSRKWKAVCRLVWERDKATCQRCKLVKLSQADVPFHMHHIESFADPELRADPNNLVVLCEVCHHFVHSRKNIDREFLPKGGAK
jgi:hypothetical protein